MHMGEGVKQDVFRAVPERHLAAMREIVGALGIWLERQAHPWMEDAAWSLLRRLEAALYMGLEGGWSTLPRTGLAETTRERLSNLIFHAVTRTQVHEEAAWDRGGRGIRPEESADGALVFALRVLWEVRGVLDGKLPLGTLERTVYAGEEYGVEVVNP